MIIFVAFFFWYFVCSSVSFSYNHQPPSPPVSRPAPSNVSQSLPPQFPNSVLKQSLLPLFPILAAPNYNQCSGLSAQLSFSCSLVTNCPPTLLAQFSSHCLLTIWLLLAHLAPIFTLLHLFCISCVPFSGSTHSSFFLHQLSSLTLLSDHTLLPLGPTSPLSTSGGLL